MEKVASQVTFPCKYVSSGCPVTLPHTDKTDHEETCEFRYLYIYKDLSQACLIMCGNSLYNIDQVTHV